MTRRLFPSLAMATLAALAATPAAVRGGEQLSTRQLLRASAAVAVVEVELGRGAQAGRATVIEWLAGDPSAGSPQAGAHVDASAWFGPCQPSRAVLERWRDSHPRHPGRPTWQRVLREGRARQVVFLAHREGVLKPVCETESMLGRGYAVHPAHAAFRSELDAALRELRASASPR